MYDHGRQHTIAFVIQTKQGLTCDYFLRIDITSGGTYYFEFSIFFERKLLWRFQC